MYFFRKLLLAVIYNFYGASAKSLGWRNISYHTSGLHVCVCVCVCVCARARSRVHTHTHTHTHIQREREDIVLFRQDAFKPPSSPQGMRNIAQT